MEQKPRYKFGKEERLKKRKQIEVLFESGRSFTHFPVKIFYKLAESEADAPESQYIKVGVSASKRQFKKAVDRNRVKRLLRETYRLNKQLLKELEPIPGRQILLFFIYVDKTLPTFALLDEKMKSGLNRLVKILKEKP